MCGLIALASWDDPLERAVLDRALSRLGHRGPDFSGRWLSPHGRVGLGHTRLRIVDLETGDQPICSEDGQCVVIVNGELYGHQDIRRNLERRGHRFRTRSDSEILLHLYEERGLECLEELRGEFAFILWDGRRRTLLAARDRFGIKPLCWSNAGKMLLLASEAKALFAAGMIPVWDRAAFFQSASMQYLLPEQTLFHGVHQLQPGHYLLARADRIDVRCYWDLDCPLADSFPSVREEEARAGLLERLEEAVALRLQADVPVCLHLSGGLDSSSIVALAARQRSAELDCFTVTFEEEVYDERRPAQEMARHAGVRLQEVHVSQGDILDVLADAVYFSEGLAINGHLSAKFLLSRAIREAGYKVVLSGEGADEVLAGYPHLRQDLLLAGGAGADVLARLQDRNAIMTGIQLPCGSSLPLDAIEERLGFVPTFLRAKGTLGLRMRSVLADDFVQQFADRDCFRVLLDCLDVTGQLAGRQRLDQATYLWTKLTLVNYILRTLGDGTEMAHGVEGRLPFLDHVLFDFARWLAPEWKIHAGVEKYLLREAMRTLLPEPIRRRQKQPFTAPPLSRFASPAARHRIRDLVRGGAFRALPFFDGRRVLTLLDRLPSLSAQEQTAADPVVMMVLSAIALQERFSPGDRAA
jgi:asparagine synthase (glutamine-hydrolysing)